MKVATHGWMQPRFRFWMALGLVLSLSFPSMGHAGWSLPKVDIPDSPPIRPSVITAGGQRLLLNHVRDTLQLGFDGKTVSVAQRGWWVINYPLQKIKGLEGKSEDEISKLLFGKPRSQIKNYYFFTEGTPPPEPAAPKGPAPIDLTPNPTIVVKPGDSIQEALDKAVAGSVIHVQPGTYSGNLYIKKSGTKDQPIRIEGIRDSKGKMPLIKGSKVVVMLLGSFLELRGFEVHGAGQAKQRAQIWGRDGYGTLIEGNLAVGADAGGIEVAACNGDMNPNDPTCKSYNQTQQAPVVRNNWVVDPTQFGIKVSNMANPKHYDEVTQNTTVPSRLRFIVEYNHVAGCKGVGGLWESGGMKVFNQTRSVYRYNTIVDNDSLGLWQDWAHFNNRIEGNLIRNSVILGLGVEASPGPNLIASNLILGQRPGENWFKASILSWDGNRSWAINNTIDARGQPTVGINLRGNTAKRNTPWDPYASRQHVNGNNVVIGTNEALYYSSKEDIAYANVCDGGKGAKKLDLSQAFRDPGKDDYRLKENSPLIKLAEDKLGSDHVRHDYFGLLRFKKQDGYSVGAFRAPLTGLKPNTTVIEVEHADGTPERFKGTVAPPGSPADAGGGPGADTDTGGPRAGDSGHDGQTDQGGDGAPYHGSRGADGCSCTLRAEVREVPDRDVRWIVLLLVASFFCRRRR
jgi:hypothetical protein